MVGPIHAPRADVGRTQKIVRKPRQGCGNCKLRKVKCDESKPKCKKCMAYGVFCNYDDRYSELQPSIDGALTVEILQDLPHPLSLSISNLVAPTLRLQSMGGLESIAVYQLRDQDLELLRRFQGRTIFTISNAKNIDVYQKELIRLACSHPYLMHSILALTLMHDRCLSGLTTPLSITEAFHWYQSVALFNSKLSDPVQPLERDPLWATAMCLGIISFFYIEAESPGEAWPLKPPSSTDLNWLKMFDGKKEVWRVAGPPLETGIFEKPFRENIKLPLESSTAPGLKALPSEFINLYDFNNPSTDDKNHYHSVATSLAGSLHLNSILPIILGFLSFIGNMRPEYKQLLGGKDPRALLLLAYWYAKVSQFEHWWISRRAALEGQAICIYLERHHRHQADMMKLLHFPKTVFRSKFPA